MVSHLARPPEFRRSERHVNAPSREHRVCSLVAHHHPFTECVMSSTTPEKNTEQNLSQYCLETATAARQASYALASLDATIKNQWLIESADRLRQSVAPIMAANEKDLAAAPGYGLTDSAVDRLRLNVERIDGIANALIEIAALPDPVGEVLDGFTRPGGLQILKKTGSSGRCVLHLRKPAQCDRRCGRHLRQKRQCSDPSWWQRSHSQQQSHRGRALGLRSRRRDSRESGSVGLNDRPRCRW